MEFNQIMTSRCCREIKNPYAANCLLPLLKVVIVFVDNSILAQIQFYCGVHRKNQDGCQSCYCGYSGYSGVTQFISQVISYDYRQGDRDNDFRDNDSVF